MKSSNQAKNRAPAPIQITSEQLLREAKERGLEDVPKQPKQFITDKEELLQYQNAKRKDFEDQIRRNRHHIGIWCRYGLWEATLKEFERSRSVFERALNVDYRNQAIWLKYAEMEMKNKFVNHARNVWDRTVTIHPRIDVFWYKYSYMEEMVGAIEQARQVFERWMAWEPDDLAWSAYIKFEMRQGELVKARGLYERYTECNPTSRAYLKYAKWEEKQFQFGLARGVYERALVEIHQDEKSEQLLIAFARFEERSKEFDRARVIYKFALENTAKEENVRELNKEFIAFEKRHGNRQGIEDAIVSRRRAEYEDKVKLNPFDYDSWFDYIRLEETEGLDNDKTRDVYERAVSHVPPLLEKRYWTRYIYLWIYYALFEETMAKDVPRARAVYKACINILPNKQFTFAKIWIAAAHLEVRQKDITGARKLLGMAIGMCSKEKIFKGYVELEMQLGEIDRCRSVYGKYLEFMPHNVSAWRALAQLESNCGEIARARGVFELAVTQPSLDMPELLWKNYIDLEIAEGESDRVRDLYSRLLKRTSHVKVWLSFAQYEAAEAKALLGAADESTAEQNAADNSQSAVTVPLKTAEELDAMNAAVLRARSVYENAYDVLKSLGLKEERVSLLESWRSSERTFGDLGEVTAVEKKLPRKIKMRRMATAEDGAEIGWEEYYDYSFPDDEKKVMGFKILENAMKWKLAAAAALQASGDGAGTTDDNDAEKDEENEGDEEGDEQSVLGKRKAQDESAMRSSEILQEEIDIDDE